MPVYCIDLTIAGTSGRYRGIGRYAEALVDALVGLQGDLRPDERLMAAVMRRGSAELMDVSQYREAQDPDSIVSTRGMSSRRYRRRHPRMLRSLLARHRIDLFHAVEGPLAPTAWIRPVKGSAPRVVATCHDLIPLEMPSEYLRTTHREISRRFRDFLAYRRADAVIAISEATLDSLERLLDVRVPKATLIHQGVDHEIFAPAVTEGEGRSLRSKYRLPPRYSLFVGDHDPRKRIPVLVQAQAQVYRVTGVPLVLAGRCATVDELDRETRRIARRLPPDALRLIARVAASDLPALYRQAELHVLPSVFEGFGLTVLEAMASGCPVITTGATSLREVGGDAVRYVPQDDVSGLEQALVEVLESAEVRARLKAAGPSRAARFSWERCARATLDLYRRITGPRPVGVSAS